MREVHVCPILPYVYYSTSAAKCVKNMQLCPQEGTLDSRDIDRYANRNLALE